MLYQACQDRRRLFSTSPTTGTSPLSSQLTPSNSPQGDELPRREVSIQSLNFPSVRPEVIQSEEVVCSQLDPRHSTQTIDMSSENPPSSLGHISQGEALPSEGTSNNTPWIPNNSGEPSGAVEYWNQLNPGNTNGMPYLTY